MLLHFMHISINYSQLTVLQTMVTCVHKVCSRSHLCSSNYTVPWHNIDKLISSDTYLFSLCYLSLGNNDDLAVLFKRHHLGNTVRMTRMVNIACRATSHRSINHQIVRQPEHIYTMILTSHIHTYMHAHHTLHTKKRFSSRHQQTTTVPQMHNWEKLEYQ